MKSLKNCTVTLMAPDLETSVSFYVDILGLNLKQKYGVHYAEIEGPGLLIGLHPTEKDLIPSSNISIGFGVENFDEEVASLREKGLKLEVKKEGPIRLANFADPGNNPLYLAELKSFDKK